MDEALTLKLGELVNRRPVGALGTLHAGAPFVSMVPYALLPDGSAFVIHVSGLAAHTKDMLADPRVCLLIMESEAAVTTPQALPRVTVTGQARQLPSGSTEHEAARRAYLGRFPDSEQMFELGDFSLFTITPTSARWVAGFGKALTLTSEGLAKAVTAAR